MRHKPHKEPWRFTIDWCFPVRDKDFATAVFDNVAEWIEREGGFVQGGSLERMDVSDVVDGSPLAKAIRDD